MCGLGLQAVGRQSPSSSRDLGVFALKASTCFTQGQLTANVHDIYT